MVSRVLGGAWVWVCIGWLCACKPPSVPNDPSAKVPLASAPVWQNWSQNLVHRPVKAGEDYYFSPTNRAELRAILARRPDGVSVRVSGQRHSQPPLVVADARVPGPEAARSWLIDLSCYGDLGAKGDRSIVLDRAARRVTVNAGVREDFLDGFLRRHDLMLQTVTAGGFFSLGGMTAVDVHGATIAAPIFAETASAFTVMGVDGAVTTIDANSARVGEWSPLQFARVSLGALGIVTSVTIDVVDRPWATTLKPGRQHDTLGSEAAFVAAYQPLLTTHSRVEAFFNPYTDKFMALLWDVDPSPARRIPNKASRLAGEPGVAVASACTIAEDDRFGAPLQAPPVERAAERGGEYVQLKGTRAEAIGLIDFSFADIELQVDRAVREHSDLWLADAARVVFMSYFIELPRIDAEGLGKVWRGLDAVRSRLRDSEAFRLAGPIEFRFIRGGDSALAGTYSADPDAVFVNFDLIAYVQAEPTTAYPAAMLAFFADIERAWLALGGFPHQGKMYGFHDPAAPDVATPPFNAGFLGALAGRRGARLEAFDRYRRGRDPAGVFCNDHVRALGLCGEASRTK